MIVFIHGLNDFLAKARLANSEPTAAAMRLARDMDPCCATDHSGRSRDNECPQCVAEWRLTGKSIDAALRLPEVITVLEELLTEYLIDDCHGTCGKCVPCHGRALLAHLKGAPCPT